MSRKESGSYNRRQDQPGHGLSTKLNVAVVVAICAFSLSDDQLVVKRRCGNFRKVGDIRWASAVQIPTRRSSPHHCRVDGVARDQLQAQTAPERFPAGVRNWPADITASAFTTVSVTGATVAVVPALAAAALLAIVAGCAACLLEPDGLERFRTKKGRCTHTCIRLLRGMRFTAVLAALDFLRIRSTALDAGHNPSGRPQAARLLCAVGATSHSHGFENFRLATWGTWNSCSDIRSRARVEAESRTSVRLIAVEVGCWTSRHQMLSEDHLTYATFVSGLPIRIT